MEETINQETNMNAFTAEARNAVNATLSPAEQVLWCGKSVKKAAWGDGVVTGFSSRAGRMIAIGMSLGFGIYVGWIFLIMLFGLCYWMFYEGIQGFGGVVAFVLVGWAVLVVGYASIGHVGLPFLTMFIAGKRSYVLTNRNAIVVMQYKSKVNIKRFELAKLQEDPEVLRVTHDGVGDVVFGYDVVHVPGDSGGSDTEMFWDTGFLSCPDAEQVPVLMREAIVKRKQVYEQETMKEMQEDYQGYLRRHGRL